jgi:DNA-binding MarR family transcriptional regulator/catechol 2,3-dioxygenase-like lactoylglutathione lyase family enzyme
MSVSPDSELATPTLMRAARGAYARAIRARLNELGVEDLPRNGAFILAGIDATGGPRTDLPAELGVTKQAVSQVIDILVGRGYVTRHPDPSDRRRIVLDLTDAGQEVLHAVVRGVDEVDRELTERTSPEQVAALRAALKALADIKVTSVAAGTGRRRPARQLRRFCPIFGVRDLRAALAHYAALGFVIAPYDEGTGYGFADRDGISLHLQSDHLRRDHPDDDHDHADHDHDHPARGQAYLVVADADALYEEWTRPGIGGQTRPVDAMPWGMREGAHTDPDGNLIRFGSSLPE